MKSLRRESLKEDNISGRLVQAGGEAITSSQLAICNKIWGTEEYPTPLKQSLAETRRKKGNHQQRKNYHIISLMCHPSRVMLKILPNVVKTQAEAIIAEQKTDLGTAFITTERFIKFMRLYERYLYHVFVDFKKAFDRVWKETPFVYYERQADPIHREPLKRGHQRLLGSVQYLVFVYIPFITGLRKV